MPDELPEGIDREAITINLQRVCCPVHGELLRADWPSGFAVVSLTIFRAAIERDPRAAPGATLLEACGWKPGMSASARTDLIDALTATRPLCYFVERTTIRDAFMEAGILRVRRCLGCGRVGLGGRVTLAYPTGRRETWRCLECMLDGGELMHRTYPDGRVWPVAT